MQKSGIFYGKNVPYFTLKSFQPEKIATFADLQQRLIHFVNERIRNGDFTERGLARLLGLSQPQMHNVLKGVRKLRPEVADSLIAKFEINVLDLIDISELRQYLEGRLAKPGHSADKRMVAPHVPPKRFAGQLAGYA